MMKKLVMGTSVAALLALGLAAPAYADECTDSIASVEAALAGDKVSETVQAEVGDLLARAKEKQAAGDSSSCVTLLTEATKVLTSK